MSTTLTWQAPDTRTPASLRARVWTAVDVLAALLAGTSSVYGGEAPQVEVRHEDTRYQVQMEAIIQATPRAVLGVLTNYERLGRINPAVKESQVITVLDPANHRVRTLIKLCIWIFCAEFTQTQDIEQTADGGLRAVILPQGSDFKSGWARWQFVDEGGATRLLFASELEPDFMIPPLIGPWLIRRMLRHEALVTIAGLERLARSAGQP